MSSNVAFRTGGRRVVGGGHRHAFLQESAPLCTCSVVIIFQEVAWKSQNWYFTALMLIFMRY